MTRHEFDNIDVPIIVQHVGGDLRLRGRPGEALVIDGDAVQVEHLGEGQPVVVRAGGDARMIVPDAVDVSLQTIGGDAKVTGVTGAVDVQRVGGDLAVRDVGRVKIKQVGGDVRIKRILGDVTVEMIGADATIRSVGGAVWIARIGADLYMRQVDGACVVEQIGSDLVLNIHFASDREYRFHVGDSILCQVRPDTNATFILPPDTHVQLDVQAEIVEEEDRQLVVLGEGSAQVHVTGARVVRLIDIDDESISVFGIQLEEELEARLSTLEETLSQQLEGLDERIQARTIQLASQAEKMTERAQQEAIRAAERVRRTMDRWATKPKSKRRTKRKHMVGRFDVRGPMEPEDEPVSEQERLMILQMVQENKITIEEAERLLAALDS